MRKSIFGRDLAATRACEDVSGMTLRDPTGTQNDHSKMNICRGFLGPYLFKNVRPLHEFLLCCDQNAPKATCQHAQENTIESHETKILQVHRLSRFSSTSSTGSPANVDLPCSTTNIRGSRPPPCSQLSRNTNHMTSNCSLCTTATHAPAQMKSTRQALPHLVLSDSAGRSLLTIQIGTPKTGKDDQRRKGPIQYVSRTDPSSSIGRALRSSSALRCSLRVLGPLMCPTSDMLLAKPGKSPGTLSPNITGGSPTTLGNNR